MNTFAERLKYAMEQADLKQSALSEQAGISKAAISQYLSGKNTPNQERIKALADVTGVTFDFLMGYGAAPVTDAPPPVKKISVKEAARCMGKSDQFVRIGLQRGLLPFGNAVPGTGNNWNYYINVILLSGTPTGGKYEKLWSQCRLLGWNISKELFWKQYIETEWVEEDGFWRQKITGYKNVDRLKKKLAEHGAVFMTTDDAGIDLPKRNFVPVRTPPAKEYWKFWRERAISINTATLQEFELDSDFWGSNESYERELIGDTSLTRRLYARQLCGLYNPNRYKAFRELVESTEDRLIVFYNFTEEMERMKGIVKGMNRPVSIQSGEVKDLGAYNFKSNSVTFIQYQAGARGGNFQKANKIIYFSLPESWELWEQSQKRIHRMGQERPCFYYWMICPGTVEESIFSTLQMRKDYNDELFRKYEDGHPKG